MTAATKKAKRPAVPEAVALRQLERQVSKTKPELQPEVRAALRRGLTSGGHLEQALHCLKLAEGSVDGVDPEAALVYLSHGLEDLAELVASVRGVMVGGPPPRQRARTPHGRAERVA